MLRCVKPAGGLQRLEGSEMVSDVGDSEGGAGHPFTGVEVRAQLIKYLADSLRDLPGRVGGLQLLSHFRQPFPRDYS